MNYPSFRRPGAVFLSLLALVSMAETSRGEVSGIDGVISMSPSRPGPLKKDAPETAPVGKIGFVVQRGNETVASFTTDAEGHFQVSVPPGHYTVSRQDAGAAIGHWRFEVDVVPNEVVKVNWVGDSGMR